MPWMWDMLLESDTIAALPGQSLTMLLYLYCLNTSSPAHTFQSSALTSMLTHTRWAIELSVTQEGKPMLKLRLWAARSSRGGVTVWACGPFTDCFSSWTHLTAPLRELPKKIGIKTRIDLGVRGGKTKKKDLQIQNVYCLSFIYFNFQWHNGYRWRRIY